MAGALVTVALCDSETERWGKDADLRNEVRAAAVRRATMLGRRFWQIQAASGRCLAVGEVRRSLLPPAR